MWDAIQAAFRVLVAARSAPVGALWMMSSQIISDFQHPWRAFCFVCVVQSRVLFDLKALGHEH